MDDAARPSDGNHNLPDNALDRQRSLATTRATYSIGPVLRQPRSALHGRLVMDALVPDCQRQLPAVAGLSL